MSRDRWFMVLIEIGQPSAVYGPYDDDDKAAIEKAAEAYVAVSCGVVVTVWHRTTARPPARELAKTFKAKAGGILAAKGAAMAVPPELNRKGVNRGEGEAG